MAGEALEAADIDHDGIAGDRRIVVSGPRGLVTSRTRPRLLGLRATLGRARRAARRGAGRPAPPKRRRSCNTPPVPARNSRSSTRPTASTSCRCSIATDGAIRSFGRDGRRLRPNIVLGGVEGLAERDWEGRRLRIGEVVIRLDSLRARCVMTTFHPDTLVQDVDVLRDISARFGGKLALNSAVEHPGVVKLGDRAELLAPDD